MHNYVNLVFSTVLDLSIGSLGRRVEMEGRMQRKKLWLLCVGKGETVMRYKNNLVFPSYKLCKEINLV